MARKPVLEGGKRDELLASARKVFMERGYDAASVRTITQACGCEVGLFYYYFKNKEQLFEQVFQQLLDELDARFAPLVELAQRAPCRALPACAETLLGLMEQSPLPNTAQLHWSVAAALRRAGLAAIIPAIATIAACATAASGHHGNGHCCRQQNGGCFFVQSHNTSLLFFFVPKHPKNMLRTHILPPPGILSTNLKNFVILPGTGDRFLAI